MSKSQRTVLIISRVVVLILAGLATLSLLSERYRPLGEGARFHLGQIDLTYEIAKSMGDGLLREDGRLLPVQARGRALLLPLLLVPTALIAMRCWPIGWIRKVLILATAAGSLWLGAVLAGAGMGLAADGLRELDEGAAIEAALRWEPLAVGAAGMIVLLSWLVMAALIEYEPDGDTPPPPPREGSNVWRMGSTLTWALVGAAGAGAAVNAISLHPVSAVACAAAFGLGVTGLLGRRWAARWAFAPAMLALSPAGVWVASLGLLARYDLATEVQGRPQTVDATIDGKLTGRFTRLPLVLSLLLVGALAYVVASVLYRLGSILPVLRRAMFAFHGAGMIAVAAVGAALAIAWAITSRRGRAVRISVAGAISAVGVMAVLSVMVLIPAWHERKRDSMIVEWPAAVEVDERGRELTTPLENLVDTYVLTNREAIDTEMFALYELDQIARKHGGGPRTGPWMASLYYTEMKLEAPAYVVRLFYQPYVQGIPARVPELPWFKDRSLHPANHTWEGMPLLEGGTGKIPARSVDYPGPDLNTESRMYELHIVDGEFVAPHELTRVLHRQLSLDPHHYIFTIRTIVIPPPSWDVTEQDNAELGRAFTRALLPEVARLLPVVD